jgi:Tfp pilus assembly protein PilN
MRAVNLLPRESQVARTRLGPIPILIVVGALVAVTMLAGFARVHASSRANESRADLELAEAAHAHTPGQEQQRPESPELSLERNSRLAALRTALSSRVSVDGVFRELAYVVPTNVWLTGLSVTIPTDVAQSTPPAAQGVAPASTVTIKGATYTQASIARFLVRLSALRSLTSARLTESARVEPDADSTGDAATPKPAKPKKAKKVVVTFTVTADLAAGASS